MTAATFRRIALALPETEERAHMKHPDFRVRGKIFATLGYPTKDNAMVKVTPETQAALIAEYPGAFRACAGAWGRAGSTSVTLSAADDAVLGAALCEAHRVTASQPAASARRSQRSPKPRSESTSSPRDRRESRSGASRTRRTRSRG